MKVTSNDFKQSTIGCIDYCRSDKISLLEIKSMAAEVGIEAIDCKIVKKQEKSCYLLTSKKLPIRLF